MGKQKEHERSSETTYPFIILNRAPGVQEVATGGFGGTASRDLVSPGGPEVDGQQGPQAVQVTPTLSASVASSLEAALASPDQIQVPLQPAHNAKIT